MHKIEESKSSSSSQQSKRADDSKTPQNFNFFDFGREQYYTYEREAVFIANYIKGSIHYVKLQKIPGQKDLPYFTVSLSEFGALAKNLAVDRKKNVHLWTKSSGMFKLVGSAFPGNIQSLDSLVSFSKSLENKSGIMSVFITNSGESKRIGIACGDKMTRKISISEFFDNDSFSNFETLVISQNVRRGYIFDSELTPIEKRSVSRLLEKCNVSVKVREKEFFDVSNMEEVFGVIMASPVEKENIVSKELGKAAFGATLKSLNLLDDNMEQLETWTMHFVDLDRIMKLDAAAHAGLALFPNPKSRGAKFHTLFGLLNKCSTPMGSRLLESWIRQPILNMSELERRYDLVELFCAGVDLRATLQTTMERFPDLDKICAKFEKKAGTLKECVSIHSLCCHLPGLVSSLRSYDGKHADILATRFTEPMADISKHLTLFRNFMEELVDFEAISRGEYLLLPSCDPQLEELAKCKTTIYDQMYQLKRKLARELKLDEDKAHIEFLKLYGHHFKVPRRSAGKLSKLKKYSVIETRQNGVKLTSHEMDLLSSDYMAACDDYTAIQDNIVKNILEVVGAVYIPSLERLSGHLSGIDVFMAFAQVSISTGDAWVRPTLKPIGSGIIKLKNSRHPCMSEEMGLKFVPNDVCIDQGKSSFQVITGPNMGGKSTFCRQVGINVILAQIGCFVPCESAVITLVDSILARIGASDVPLKGVSTFMAEMLDSSSMLKSATSNSLMIIDELGRGTSTYEGFGIAWAMAEHIVEKIRCFCLFATHFHEMNELREKYPTVVTKHTSAKVSDNDLVMLYKVKDGPAEGSFGIQVAKLAGFQDNIVKMAEKKLVELENFGGFTEEVYKKMKLGHRDGKKDEENKKDLDGDISMAC